MQRNPDRGRSGLQSLVVLLVLSAPGTSSAITLLESDRDLSAFTFVTAQGVLTNRDSRGIRRTSDGFFSEVAVAATQVGDLVQSNAEALHDTDVALTASGALQVTGSAGSGASADAFDPGTVSRADGISSSSLLVTFALERSRDFILGASLSADLIQADVFSGEGPILSNVFAEISLIGVASGEVAFLRVEDFLADGASVAEDLQLSGVLEADTYQLVLASQTELIAFEDSATLGLSGFGIDFRVVPEPRTGVLLAAGLMVLASRARRSRPSDRS